MIDNGATNSGNNPVFPPGKFVMCDCCDVAAVTNSLQLYPVFAFLLVRSFLLCGCQKYFGGRILTILHVFMAGPN